MLFNLIVILPCFNGADIPRQRTQGTAPKVREFVVSDECIICQEQHPDMLFHPCGHICMCEACTQREKLNVCPMCRQVITSSTLKREARSTKEIVTWIRTRFAENCPHTLSFLNTQIIGINGIEKFTYDIANEKTKIYHNIEIKNSMTRVHHIYQDVLTHMVSLVAASVDESLPFNSKFARSQRRHRDRMLEEILVENANLSMLWSEYISSRMPPLNLIQLLSSNDHKIITDAYYECAIFNFYIPLTKKMKDLVQQKLREMKITFQDAFEKQARDSTERALRFRGMPERDFDQLERIQHHEREEAEDQIEELDTNFRMEQSRVSLVHPIRLFSYLICWLRIFVKAFLVRIRHGMHFFNCT